MNFIEHKYKHTKGMWFSSFELAAATEEEPIIVALRDVASYDNQPEKLRIVNAKKHKIFTPMSELPQSLTDEVFIVRYQHQHFLINRNGYRHALFCWPCVFV